MSIFSSITYVLKSNNFVMRSSVLILILLNKVEGPARRTKNNNKIKVTKLVFQNFVHEAKAVTWHVFPVIIRDFLAGEFFPYSSFL